MCSRKNYCGEKTREKSCDCGHESGKGGSDCGKQSSRCGNWEKEYLGKSVSECKYFRVCRDRFIEAPCKEDDHDHDCDCDWR